MGWVGQANMQRTTIFFNILTPKKALRLLGLLPSTASPITGGGGGGGLTTLSTLSQLTPAAIKKAFIAQTLLCHPDLLPDDPHATERFTELGEALNVALHALKSVSSDDRLSGASSESSSKGNNSGSSSPLMDLRHAIVDYHTHAQAQKKSSSVTSEAAGSLDRDAEAAIDAWYFTPTLEHIQLVCQRERQAKQSVQKWCAEMPHMLSGPSALFDTVALFPTRYTSRAATCMDRFVSHLPLIVSRVVRRRAKRKLLNKRSGSRASRSLSHGWGTGARAAPPPIESMAMKPLVLMGALVFQTQASSSGMSSHTEEVQGGMGSSSTDGGRPAAEEACSSTYKGVRQCSDIQVCSELQCVISSHDSIDGVVDKLAAWETASFDRLQVELAMADACRLIAEWIGISRTMSGGHPPPPSASGSSSVAVTPHLLLPTERVQAVLAMVHEVVKGLCLLGDEKQGSGRGESEMLLRIRETAADGGASLSVAECLSMCRELSPLAAPYVRGSVLLVPPAGISEEDPAVPSSPAAAPGSFHVARHPSCCIGEEVFFSVSLPLTADIAAFLTSWRLALSTVLVEAHKSQQLLPELLSKREAVQGEEFIPKPSTPDEFTYRPAVFTFLRLFNMNTKMEATFWSRVWEHREYLGQHARLTSPVHVFFQCMPYGEDSAAAAPPQPHGAASSTMGLGEEGGADRQDQGSSLPAGWVDHCEEDGCDTAILTRVVLEDEGGFYEWLVEVVEQSALQRHILQVLADSSIGYLERDPSLPLTHFLSFIHQFAKSAAVRHVLEGTEEGGAPTATTAAAEGKKSAVSPPKAVTADDTGLTIVVGFTTDVRDGGRLYIAWDTDPNTLIALLKDPTDAADSPLSALDQ